MPKDYKRYYKTAKSDLALLKTMSKKKKRAPMQNMNALAYPAFKVLKMNYWDSIVVSQTTGTGMVQQFRLNSLYDPDYTYTGHQPYYYDQMTPQYATYRVYSVKIDYAYTCENGSGVPLDSQIVWRGTPDGTTPTPTIAGFRVESERPGAMNKYYSVGGQPVTGTLKFSCRKILGMSKGQYDDDDKTAAAVTTNPAIVPYLNFLALSTAADSVHVLRIKMTFYCKFFNRVIVSGS